MLNGLAPERRARRVRRASRACVGARGAGAQASRRQPPAAARRELRRRRRRAARALRAGARANDGPVCRYRLEFQPPWAGSLLYEIRALPEHPHLTHPYELGLMRKSLGPVLDGQEARARSGRPLPPRRDGAPGRRELLAVQPARDATSGCGSTAARRTRRRSSRSSSIRASTARTRGGTRSSRARSPAGTTRGAPTARPTPRRACGSMRAASCSIPWARLVSDALWRRADAHTRRRRSGLRARADRARPTTTTGKATRRSSARSSDTIVYEMHVGGFTRHPSSGVESPGTYRGVIDKIPHLAVARRHRRRAAARVRVRPAGRAGRGRRARAAQLLGLQPARVLRAACSTSRHPATRAASSATWSRRCTRRGSA